MSSFFGPEFWLSSRSKNCQDRRGGTGNRPGKILRRRSGSHSKTLQNNMCSPVHRPQKPLSLRFHSASLPGSRGSSGLSPTPLPLRTRRSVSDVGLRAPLPLVIGPPRQQGSARCWAASTRTGSAGSTSTQARRGSRGGRQCPAKESEEDALAPERRQARMRRGACLP